MSYFFLRSNFFTRNIRCPEMSPSLSRKRLLCACHHPTVWDIPPGIGARRRNPEAAAVGSLTPSPFICPSAHS